MIQSIIEQQRFKALKINPAANTAKYNLEVRMVQDFDLHLHTVNSDGEYSTSELVELLKQQGIKIFSVTDHDNFNSVYELEKCDLSGMKYINGVEISSILDNKYEMHILGYSFDENNKKLHDLVDGIKQNRVKRFYEMSEYLTGTFGLKFAREDLDATVKAADNPGRPHLARLMVKYKYVSSVAEAFNKYLEDIKTGTSHRIPADKAIGIIKESDGKAIWAHPKKTERKFGIDFSLLMPRLCKLGLDGIEAFSSLHSLDEAKRYLRYAQKHALLVSGGSDFHGENVKQSAKIGVVFNSGEDYKIDKNDISLLSAFGID